MSQHFVRGLVVTAGLLLNPLAMPAQSGHDQPIVVQGGSFWIWSAGALKSADQYSVVIQSAGLAVTQIGLFSDQGFQTQIGSYFAVGAATPFSLCASPHNVMLASPNDPASGNNQVTASSSVLNDNLPVFLNLPFGDASKAPYSFGRRHVSGVPLKTLTLATGPSSQGNPICAAPAGSDCTTTSSAPCNFYCSEKCFVKLDYDVPPAAPTPPVAVAPPAAVAFPVAAAPPPPPLPAPAPPPAPPAATKSGNTPLTGHDTPIVVQGGTLDVFTSQKLDLSDDQRQVSITLQSIAWPATAYLYSSDDATDTTFQHAIFDGSFPGTGWTLCAPNPHWVRVVPDLNGNITVTSSDPQDDGVKPVFDKNRRKGNGELFKSGYRHRTHDSFEKLFFVPLHASCPAKNAAIPFCSGAVLSSPCRVNCHTPLCKVAVSAVPPTQSN